MRNPFKGTPRPTKEEQQQAEIAAWAACLADIENRADPAERYYGLKMFQERLERAGRDLWRQAKQGQRKTSNRLLAAAVGAGLPGVLLTAVALNCPPLMLLVAPTMFGASVGGDKLGRRTLKKKLAAAEPLQKALAAHEKTVERLLADLLDNHLDAIVASPKSACVQGWIPARYAAAFSKATTRHDLRMTQEEQRQRRARNRLIL